jgi:XTP/dITP diphosphohydrolase
MKKLVLASHNAGKLVEMQEILADLPLQITSAAELGLGDVEETGLTFVENALLKARAACEATGQRSARFYAVIVLLRHATDPQPLICEGRWEGQIIRELRGTNGFGYNPVFLDTTHGLTAAEMEPALKNAISHRAIALQQLKQQLKQQFAD